MKKLDQNFVARQFRARDCELLDVYTNRNTPMKFKCRCGSTSVIRYSSFQRGSYCLSCGGKKKYTIDQIREEFFKRGCELLEDQYIDCFTKMKARCSCGRIFKINWNNLQQGKRCRLCGLERSAASIKGPKHYAWIPDRKEAKLRRLLSARCRAHLQRALKRIGTTKSGKTFEMLGYSSTELYEHVTNHPNWSLVKDGDWHLDHKFPVKAFNDYGVEDVGLINALENLQPMDVHKNFKKKDNYDAKKFEEWLIQKGYEIIEV